MNRPLRTGNCATEPEAGGHVLAIALTAFAGSEDRRQAMLAGFDIHVAKPVEPGELVAVVGRLAVRRRQSGLHLGRVGP